MFAAFSMRKTLKKEILRESLVAYALGTRTKAMVAEKWVKKADRVEMKEAKNVNRFSCFSDHRMFLFCGASAGSTRSLNIDLHSFLRRNCVVT